MFLEVMMTINLILTLVLVVSFAIVTLDQRRRIAVLEARFLVQPPVRAEFVDGQNRLLTMVQGFVDHAGMVRTSEDMKLESDFAGMPVGIYVVATARQE